MNSIITTELNESMLEFHRLTFETLGFKEIVVNFDPDYFTIRLKSNVTNPKKIYRSIESLTFCSLELFSRYLTANISDIQKSNSYFINLSSGKFKSESFKVEIDYLTTSSDVIYLEAYCYDDNEFLVAKGGISLIKA